MLNYPLCSLAPLHMVYCFLNILSFLDSCLESDFSPFCSSSVHFYLSSSKRPFLQLKMRKKIMMSQAKSLFLAGHGNTYSSELSQQVKTRGHGPTSGSMPGYSLGQAAADPITSSWRFMSSQGRVLLSRFTPNVLVWYLYVNAILPVLLITLLCTCMAWQITTLHLLYINKDF